MRQVDGPPEVNGCDSKGGPITVLVSSLDFFPTIFTINRAVLNQS